MTLPAAERRRHNGLARLPVLEPSNQAANDRSRQQGKINGIQKESRILRPAAQARAEGAKLTGAPSAVDHDADAPRHRLTHFRRPAAQNDDGRFQARTVLESYLKGGFPLEGS